MTRFLAICQNTFLQTIRQPIYIILLLVTFGLLTVTLPMSGWTMGGTEDYHETDQKMLENLGLGTLLTTGLLLAVFSASSVLSKEIEDKTALTVVSKPVARATFVLGKFGGVSGAVTAGLYLCSIIFLLTVRHRVRSAVTDPYDFPVIVFGCIAFVASLTVSLLGNYFFAWTFTSTLVWCLLIFFSTAMGLTGAIGKEWTLVRFGDGIRPDLILAILLIYMAVMVFVALAVAVSTRLGGVLTLLVCLGLFFVGWTHEKLFLAADSNFTVKVLRWITPDLSMFDLQDALTADKPIPLGYVGLAAAYCGCYIAALLAAGVAMFQRRELEATASSSVMPGAVSVLAWIGRMMAVILAVAALLLVAKPEFHSAVGLGWCAGLLSAAVVSWVLWGHFGRGARWSYWLVLVLTVAALLRAVAGAVAPDLGAALYVGHNTAAIAIQLAVSVAILLVLFLPRTRHHFATTTTP